MQLAPQQASWQGIKIVAVEQIGLDLPDMRQESAPKLRQVKKLPHTDAVCRGHVLDADDPHARRQGFCGGQLSEAIPTQDADLVSGCGKAVGFLEHAWIGAKGIGEEHDDFGHGWQTRHTTRWFW